MGPERNGNWKEKAKKIIPPAFVGLAVIGLLVGSLGVAAVGGAGWLITKNKNNG